MFHVQSSIELLYAINHFFIFYFHHQIRLVAPVVSHWNFRRFLWHDFLQRESSILITQST